MKKPKEGGTVRQTGRVRAAQAWLERVEKGGGGTKQSDLNRCVYFVRQTGWGNDRKSHISVAVDIITVG